MHNKTLTSIKERNYQGNAQTEACKIHSAETSLWEMPKFSKIIVDQGQYRRETSTHDMSIGVGTRVCLGPPFRNQPRERYILLGLRPG